MEFSKSDGIMSVEIKNKKNLTANFVTDSFKENIALVTEMISTQLRHIGAFHFHIIKTSHNKLFIFS